ncbi:MAG: elongator complex protein 3 [Oscillospiraceae bacterium]
MNKHSNISIFIPHMGCPNQCSFCNQRTISSTVSAPSAENVRDILEKSCPQLTSPQDTEIAFFGGSFTAIERGYMVQLLETAHEFIQQYHLAGIRISTRPDCIDEDILRLLKRYGVTSIELGAQSMSAEVLTANRRGHSPEDVRNASAMIKQYGFELGLQMMTGLYKSTMLDEINTMNEIISIAPHTVRIYPVAVLEHTELAELYRNGEYTLYPFDDMVELCAEMLERFEGAGIRVIKLGLHASESVEQGLAAGYYHPAFRELCEGVIYRKKIENALSGDVRQCVVRVAPRCISQAMGQKKCNIKYFAEKGINIKIIPDENITKQFDVQI